MRKPSIPGQSILGERGANLSSVLQAICEKPELKQALSHWIQELTPMDVIDFKFWSAEVSTSSPTARSFRGRRQTKPAEKLI